MLKILQARLQQYVNWELPSVQAGFRKDRGTRDQIAYICWIIEKVREFQKKNESESCSVVSDSLRSHGLYSPWISLDQNTRVGSLSLLQGIFPTQRSNPGLLHCRWILYWLSHSWLRQSLWLCGAQQTVENSERDGNTRPPDLPLEKPVCRSGSNS